MSEKHINQQQKLHAYMIPVTSGAKKETHRKNGQHSSSNKNNYSLPSIGFPKQQKVNNIRNKVDEANNQIALLKARINTLKLEKQRNDKKRQKHQQQISFLQTVRERMYQQKQYKKQINEQRQKQQEKMKNQATQLREQLVKNRELSKSIVREKKLEDAQEERQKKKDDEQFIKRVRSIEKSENQLKAQNVKKQQYEIQEKLREFKMSRISFASNNHRQKVRKTLSQKQKAQRTLSKLKKKENRLIEDFKKSEADMMSSLYELESLNPQKKSKKTNNSTKQSQKFFK